MKKPWIIAPRTGTPVRCYRNDRGYFTIEERTPDGRWIFAGEVDDVEDFYQLYFYVEELVYDYAAIHRGKWVKTQYG